MKTKSINVLMRIKSLNLFTVLILLTVFFAWVITAYKTEPFLLYQYQQIGFNTGFDFFKGYLEYPGGVSNYVADFISQFFTFNLFGSLLIVFVASIQGLIALDIVRRLKGKTNLDLLYFSIFLIIGIVVICDCRYPYYASIRLLFAIVFTWTFYILKGKFPKQSSLIWILLATVNFYIASGASLIVYAISTSMIIIHTRKDRKWMFQVPIFMLLGIVLPWLSFKFIFPTTLQNLYRLTEVKPPQMLAYSTLYQLYGYYSLLPVILISVFFIKRNSGGTNETKSANGRYPKKTGFHKKTWFSLSLQLIIGIVIGTFLYVKSYDSFRKNLIRIESYSQEGRWNEILDIAETINFYDFRVNYQVNRVYAHLGHLPDKLFNYPQVLGVHGLFFDSSSMNGSFTMPISDLYYDLGFMSESLRWAYEAQTLIPNSPRILQRIIMIHLVNEKYDLADEFLKVLRKNMIYREWVKKYEKYVSNPELTSKDSEIAEKRSFTPSVNKVNFNPYENLQLLLEINSAETDSYHCFSGAGHWFVFSSKRMDGLHTRPFFSYLDEEGNATKPFVLPQKDPEFYATFIKNYNIPELIKGEVPYSQIQIRDEILKTSVLAIPDPNMDSIYMKNHLREMVEN